MNRLLRIWRRCEPHLEECLACVALLLMAALVFAQVIARYLFQTALSWTDEVAVYCMLWSVYLSASWAVRERAHIRVTNLLRVFPGNLSLGLVLVSDAIWLITTVVICWQGVLLNQSLWQQTYTSPVLGIDQKWPYMIVPIGFGLMAARLMQVYYRWARFGESPLDPPAMGD